VRNRRIAGSDLTLSVLGLGGNNFDVRLDETETRAVVHAALDVGVTFFDTADLYGAAPGGGEILLGKALKEVRHRVALGTKFGWDLADAAPCPGPRGASTYVVRAAEASLRRLGTDYIDLYQYHQPDGVTPLTETLDALEGLVRAGKVRYVGCSNFSASLVSEASAIAARHGAGAAEGFVTLQACYHLLDRSIEAELVAACLEGGLALLPYYPLANGLLSGKYKLGEGAPPGSRMSWRTSWFTDEARERVELFREIAARFGVSLLELALGWLAAQSGVACVIAGAMSASQIAANAAAVDWIPPTSALEAIDQVVPSGTKVV
jgi:aryl-alcohol dehydrogenase-like predicted oxidoreductase